VIAEMVFCVLECPILVVPRAPLAGVGAVVEFNFGNGGKTQRAITLYLKVLDTLAAVVKES